MNSKLIAHLLELSGGEDFEFPSENEIKYVTENGIDAGVRFDPEQGYIETLDGEHFDAHDTFEKFVEAIFDGAY